MFETFGVSVGLLFCSMWIWFFLHQYHKVSMRDALQSLAKKHGGHLIPGQDWMSANGDHVELVDHNGRSISIHAHVQVNHSIVDGRIAKPFSKLRVEAVVGGSKPTLEIIEEDLINAVSNLLGGQDIQIHVPDYDQRFIIRSSDEPWATSLLYGATRLRELHLKNPRTRVDFDGSTLTLEAHGRFQSERKIEALVELARLFLQEIHVAPHTSDGDVQRGQLSLARPQDNGGELSLADGDGVDGALSVSHDEQW